MEDLQNIPLTRLEPSTEQATAMQHALKFHSSPVKPPLARGEISELVVLSSTFWKPTNKLILSLLTLVLPKATTNVKATLSVD
jgi:hypothetical protein